MCQNLLLSFTLKLFPTFFWPLPCRKHCTAAGGTGTTAFPQPHRGITSLAPCRGPFALRLEAPRQRTSSVQAPACSRGKTLREKELHFPPGEGGGGKVALTGTWKISSGGCWSPVREHPGAGASRGQVPDASWELGMQQSISIPTGLSQDLLFALE